MYIFLIEILRVVILRKRGMVWTHLVSPKFHQNSPRAVDEWGNELFLMFEKLDVKKYEK